MREGDLPDLLVEIEAAYDIVVPDELLTREMFATPRTLWTFISSLLASGKK